MSGRKVLFDARHRWGDAVEDGARLTRACRVCGITRTYDRLIPDALISEFIRVWATPNPYRALFR